MHSAIMVRPIVASATLMFYDPLSSHTVLSIAAIYA